MWYLPANEKKDHLSQASTVSKVGTWGLIVSITVCMATAIITVLTNVTALLFIINQNLCDNITVTVLSFTNQLV